MAGATGALDEGLAQEMCFQWVAEAIKAKGFTPGKRLWWKTLTGAITSGPINTFEAAGIKLVEKRGHYLLGIGDDGVRIVLEKFMAEGAPAADLISIVPESGKIAITEVKGGKDILKAVDTQLKSTVEAFKTAGWQSEIEYVEVIVEKDVKIFDDAKNWIIKDGYLFDTINNKPVAVPGFPTIFVRATKL